MRTGICAWYLIPVTRRQNASLLDRFTKQLKKILYSYKATVCLSKDACRLSLIFVHLPPPRRIFPPGLADTHGMQCPACCESFYRLELPGCHTNLAVQSTAPSSTSAGTKRNFIETFAQSIPESCRFYEGQHFPLSHKPNKCTISLCISPFGAKISVIFNALSLYKYFRVKINPISF